MQHDLVVFIWIPLPGEYLVWKEQQQKERKKEKRIGITIGLVEVRSIASAYCQNRDNYKMRARREIIRALWMGHPVHADIPIESAKWWCFNEFNDKILQFWNPLGMRM